MARKTWGPAMQLENYKAEAPLPDTVGAAVSGVRIALILMGATIALPAFVKIGRAHV